MVGAFILEEQENLEGFITLPTRSFFCGGWVNLFPARSKNITANAVAHPLAPAEWRITWQ